MRANFLTPAVIMDCSFRSVESQCGSFSKSFTIIALNLCKHDMTSYLMGLGISLKRRKHEENTISEVELILNRAGVFDDRDYKAMTICPKHRRELSLDWPGRKRKSCNHPQHKGQRKQMKYFRRVNANMSKEIFALTNMCVPIGSGNY